MRMLSSKQNYQLIVIQIVRAMNSNSGDQNNQIARELRDRMRMGSGLSKLIQADNSPHQLDSLQRFKKDYAAYDRELRDQGVAKRQMDIEKKRLEQLQRQNLRWEKAQDQFTQNQNKYINRAYSQMLGQKKAHNTNGQAYNPINLSYDSNMQGQKLKKMDEDKDIRRFVRARNMDDRGNSKYDLISGRNRVGIEQVVPEHLNQRYSQKLTDLYEGYRLRVPSDDSAYSQRNRYPI